MGAVASVVGTLIGIIILAVIGVIAYYGYQIYESFPSTNCFKYARESAAIGTENGPGCAAGDAQYGGVCYVDNWTQGGGKKTAVCTVDWGSYGGVVTNCSIGIQNLNIGDECPMLGTGYHKTATCTCQLRGVVTASKYCINRGIAKTCKQGWDYYGGVCYADACPDGYKRTAVCTCQKI